MACQCTWDEIERGNNCREKDWEFGLARKGGYFAIDTICCCAAYNTIVDTELKFQKNSCVEIEGDTAQTPGTKGRHLQLPIMKSMENLLRISVAHFIERRSD